METRWLYVTSEQLTELKKESKEVCVIPMGCVEKRGTHLPLGTDMLQASVITQEASKIETFTVFPDFIFGDVPGNYSNMPEGTISIPLETQMLLLEHICDQIAKNGYKKIAIVNGHDGNKPWLATFLRKLENKPHNYVVVIINMKLMEPREIDNSFIQMEAERIAEAIRFLKEDEDLVKWHNENWNTNI